MPIVVIRQRKSWRRRDGVFLYFEVCHHNIAACTLSPFSQGQCWCDCEPQGRNERFRNHWPRSKRMRASISLHTSVPIALLTNHSLFQRTGGSMASYCIKCWHCRVIEILIHCFPPFSVSRVQFFFFTM